MQIGAHRNVIILLAASSPFSLRVSILWSNLRILRAYRTSARSWRHRSRRHSGHWRVGLQYTYMERDEDRRLDMEGHVKSDDVDVSRTILVDGVPFEQLVERNGQPPRRRTSTKRKRSSTS